jgi:hypothetical protein
MVEAREAADELTAAARPAGSAHPLGPSTVAKAFMELSVTRPVTRNRVHPWACGFSRVLRRPVPGGNRRRRVDILLRGARIAVFPFASITSVTHNLSSFQVAESDNLPCLSA